MIWYVFFITLLIIFLLVDYIEIDSKDYSVGFLMLCVVICLITGVLIYEKYKNLENAVDNYEEKINQLENVNDEYFELIGKSTADIAIEYEKKIKQLEEHISNVKLKSCIEENS